ncbi:MAG: cbb3-type cytochrome c oxidase subunit I [Syntrophaceae bacterium]|jgi:nitric oxide reductase subunit B|nr:cbb3-type cytochrome c oxidase subunit I [Syntrophaceae bacterium]
MSLTKLKWAAILSFVVAMAILLGGGWFSIDELPPYPGKVVGPDNKVLFQKADILAGQDVYQRYGLMDHGSIWGHGSQRGPEFSAATLHIVGEALRNQLARQEYGKPYSEVEKLQKELVDVKVRNEVKTNRYDRRQDVLLLTPSQALALEQVNQYWAKMFKEGNIRYGFLPNTVPTDQERLQISRFFFWTAWVASTLRPGKDYTYTNNWPPDQSVGNVATTDMYFWTLGGIFSLFLVLGLFIYWVHHYGIWYGSARGVSLAEKLIDMPLTPSQFRAAKYFLVVVLLLLLQTSFGGLLAHYTVHPGSFWFQFIADLIPYSWAKSWHLQLAIFWIATTWVASAIYLAPIIGGKEPPKQGLLVQVLFLAILVVALGSLLGQVAGIKGLLGDWWFWLGHQGWEYLELGRFWQILLFVGLMAWLLIVYRAIAPHLKLGHKDEFTSLIYFYVFSAILVVAFYGFGFFYGKGSHITLADYWRWFVVHIWVESIFEFFGVAVIAVLLVAMGLVTARAALTVAYFTAALVFISGIVGTAHHYFWYGGPVYWLGLGAVFSSIEPVPLLGLVTRGLMEFRSIQKEGKDFPYRWPMFFLVAASFWNFLGAGVFGFLINLPIVNYYEHGTYLTMNHGHTALFGTYGMLSIALLLFSWRGLVDKAHWNDKTLRVSFWGLNGGLFLMAIGTLFPVGAVQAWTSFKEGLWVARDASFFERTGIYLLGNLRVIPDTIIIFLGVLPLAYFLFKTYPRLKAAEIKDGESVWKRIGVEL